mmetsp:Transcript_12157/g.19072  ORF Transcript_12157/g.19072 Transcript_12157/m.19072 type:complete len:103 (-) Transcript_12157:447-755(-)
MSEALCTKIDTELLAYLRCVDEYQTAASEVAACCKSGIFDIARARKSMGNRGMGVTELQYPKTMTAGSKIEVKCTFVCTKHRCRWLCPAAHDALCTGGLGEQ